jgi:fluoride exporter
MKGIEFILLAVGAILGAYIRYKITSFPLILGIIGSNVLIVNIMGSFILGIFSVFISQLEFRPKVFLSNSNRI